MKILYFCPQFLFFLLNIGKLFTLNYYFRDKCGAATVAGVFGVCVFFIVTSNYCLILLQIIYF